MGARQRFASSRNGTPAYYAIVQKANLKSKRGYASGDWLYYGALASLTPADRRVVNLALDIVQPPASASA